MGHGDAETTAIRAAAPIDENELELALLDSASSDSMMKNDLNLHGDTARNASPWLPKNGVAALTVDVESNNAPAIARSPSKTRSLSTVSTQDRPSRWRTPEHIVHYAMVAYFIFYKMVQIPVRLSQSGRNDPAFDMHKRLTLFGRAESHPNYWIYSKRLSEGWIAGRKVVSILYPHEISAETAAGQHRRAIQVLSQWLPFSRCSIERLSHRILYLLLSSSKADHTVFPQQLFA